MRATSTSSHLLLFASICLQVVLGVSGDSQSSSTGAKAESHTSSSKTSTKVILILVGFGAVAGFSFFLYKLWQKKKRDEQYARLLKLFEEDDELEVELGLRD
uniref:Transmembrane protein n=1 Tax=Noccaea caerulescens TaxID=107243 RepID=A0A1J3H2F0_NOCCA